MLFFAEPVIELKQLKPEKEIPAKLDAIDSRESQTIRI